MSKRTKILMILVLSLSLLPIGYALAKGVVENYGSLEYNDRLQKELYKNLYAFETDFSIAYTGNTYRIDLQLERIMDALKEKDVYLYENISKWNAKYIYTGNRAKINFSVHYLTDAQQEKYVDHEVKRIANAIALTTTTDFEKIKAVNDYIVLNGQYSDETNASQYAPYTLLTEKKAVCQAYALLTYRLLQALQVDVKYVKGHAGGELHGWNLVKIDDEWYHLDVTWNDPLPNRENEVSYQYFLVSDEKMRKTHYWQTYDYPVAYSTKYELMYEELYANH